MVFIIEGHRYSGRFEIEPYSASGTSMVDSEVGRHPENWRRDWFEGKGSVTDSETGVRERFLFNPKGKSQEHVVNLGEGVSRDAIRDYEGVVDLALGLMYESAQKSDKPVPSITPPTLTLDMLSNARLMEPDFVI